MKILAVFAFFISLSLLNISFLSLSHDLKTTKEKFKVGDCVAVDYDEKPEKWEKKARYQFSYKILEVGEHSYLTTYWYGSNSEVLVNEAFHTIDFSFVSILRVFKINCETLDKE